MDIFGSFHLQGRIQGIQNNNKNVHQMINLCKERAFKDVTIICKDGKSQSNSLLLASIFPLVMEIFQSLQYSEENIFISLPDALTRDVDGLFEAIYMEKESFLVCKDILNLLNKRDYVCETDDEILDIKNCKSASVESNIYYECNLKTKIDETEDFKVEDDGDNFDNLDDLIETIDPLENEDDDNVLKEPQLIKFSKAKEPKTVKSRKRSNIKNDKLYVIESIGRRRCTRCKSFIPLSEYDEHIKEHAERENSKKCPHCDYTSPYGKRNIDRHIIAKHPQRSETCQKFFEEGKRRCTRCKSFIPLSEYDKHIKEHAEREKVICNICGSILCSKSSLEGHIAAMHTVREKKFFCEECGASFWQKNSYRTHMRNMHTSTRLPCPHCGEKIRPSYLDRHISNVHTPDSEKKHQCQDCGKGFHSKFLLDKHRMNVHLKLRPYKCRFGCDIAYNDISNRNHHEKKQHGKLFTTDNREKESIAI